MKSSKLLLNSAAGNNGRSSAGGMKGRTGPRQRFFVFDRITSEDKQHELLEILEGKGLQWGPDDEEEYRNMGKTSYESQHAAPRSAMDDLREEHGLQVERGVTMTGYGFLGSNCVIYDTRGAAPFTGQVDAATPSCVVEGCESARHSTNPVCLHHHLQLLLTKNVGADKISAANEGADTAISCVVDGCSQPACRPNKTLCSRHQLLLDVSSNSRRSEKAE